MIILYKAGTVATYHFVVEESCSLPVLLLFSLHKGLDSNMEDWFSADSLEKFEETTWRAF